MQHCVKNPGKRTLSPDEKKGKKKETAVQQTKQAKERRTREMNGEKRYKGNYAMLCF